jgi:hypothetical protein
MAAAAAAKVNVRTVAAVIVAVTAVASVAATEAVLHVTTIAMVNSSLRDPKAHALPRVKVADVGPEWVNNSPPVLRMSHALLAPQLASQTRCAPAWI